MTGSRQRILALVNAVAGREDEFRMWYWGTHVPEVLELPGFVSAQRLALREEPGAAAPFRYATIYEIEGSALEARDRMLSSGLRVSEAMDAGAMIVAPYGADGEA